MSPYSVSPAPRLNPSFSSSSEGLIDFISRSAWSLWKAVERSSVWGSGEVEREKERERGERESGGRNEVDRGNLPQHISLADSREIILSLKVITESDCNFLSFEPQPYSLRGGQDGSHFSFHAHGTSSSPFLISRFSSSFSSLISF